MASAESVTSWLDILVHFPAEWDEIWYGNDVIQFENLDSTFQLDLCHQGYTVLLTALRTLPLANEQNWFGSNLAWW